MKLTRHNGRSGRKGVYNPRHNDRRFDVENSEHINQNRARHNIYWDCYRGYTTARDREEADGSDFAFSEVERRYYSDHYSTYVNAQNERNEKNRHKDRNRTVEHLLANDKTCPEESIYQIGTLEESVSPRTLFLIVSEFYKEFDRRFGEHVHILDWALHLDEGTPHVHERHVFDCTNKYGEVCPQQEKALEALGIPLPNPDKPKGKNNNRKQTFDAQCREMLFEISRKHGLNLDREPEYGGRKYLEKQDFILAKQKELLAEREQELSEKQTELEAVTMKISDVEALVEEVSDTAYEKACEVVTEAVRVETQKADIAIVEDYKQWVTAPERKLSPEKKDFAQKCLDVVQGRLKKAGQTVLRKVQSFLQKPEIKQAGKEQIKEAAKESLSARLAREKENVRRRKEERRERGELELPRKKRGLEI